jgi:hypothetical protein
VVEPETPFVDLPASLVEQVLEETEHISSALLNTFVSMRDQRTELREGLRRSGLLTHDSSLGYPPIPTTSAIDGSYAIERLLTADLAASASVAVEGLTPPSEERYWDQPRHMAFIQAEVHHEATTSILRAVMVGYELVLATRAPHDLVMLDFTLTLPAIYFNQALSQAHQAPELRCSREFRSRAVEFLEAYRDILRSERSDRNYVGLPKYSTRREVGRHLGWSTQHDDRGLLTILLNPGELVTPLPLEQPAEAWHLGTNSLPPGVKDAAAKLAEEITSLLGIMRIFYYKPHQWLPALRIEVPASGAQNQHRLASIIQGVKHQCAAPGMLEPYPLYLADRTVKALARAVPAFRQVTTQRVSEKYEGDVGEVFFAMHGYRSESGV